MKPTTKHGSDLNLRRLEKAHVAAKSLAYWKRRAARSERQEARQELRRYLQEA